MPEGLIESWRRDLSDKLAEGAQRLPARSREGTAWLSFWALSALVAGIGLYAFGGQQAGFSWLNTAASHHPDWVWICLTILGDERIPFAVALMLGLRYPRLFWALVVAGLIALVYSRGLKILLDTARPPGVLEAGSFNLIGLGHRRTGFPSGHSVNAAVFFGVLIYYTSRTGIRAVFLTLGLLAGLSRVAVGVHWPIDVAGGMLGGVLAARLGVEIAARWPGPISRLPVHLAAVAVLSVLSLSLFYYDGGYPLMATPLALLGSMALSLVLVRYLIAPLIRQRATSRDALVEPGD